MASGQTLSTCPHVHMSTCRGAVRRAWSATRGLPLSAPGGDRSAPRVFHSRHQRKCLQSLRPVQALFSLDVHDLIRAEVDWPPRSLLEIVHNLVRAMPIPRGIHRRLDFDQVEARAARRSADHCHSLRCKGDYEHFNRSLGGSALRGKDERTGLARGAKSAECRDYEGGGIPDGLRGPRSGADRGGARFPGSSHPRALGVGLR